MQLTEATLREVDPVGPRADELLDRFSLQLLVCGAQAMALAPDRPLHGYIVDTEGEAGDHLRRLAGREVGPDPIVGIMRLEPVRDLIRRYQPEVLSWFTEDRALPWRRLPIVIWIGPYLTIAWVWCPVTAEAFA